jgi:hypothetical protein
LLSHAVYRAGPAWSVGFSRERVDFCCHDKVVSVDPINLVRPDGHRHSTPLGENRRMMTFHLGESLYAIRKAGTAAKSLTPKSPARVHRAG